MERKHESIFNLSFIPELIVRLFNPIWIKCFYAFIFFFLVGSRHRKHPRSRTSSQSLFSVLSFSIDSRIQRALRFSKVSKLRLMKLFYPAIATLSNGPRFAFLFDRS